MEEIYGVGEWITFEHPIILWWKFKHKPTIYEQCIR